MSRQVKLRAWFKEASVMLDNPTLYADGMLGMAYCDFKNYIEKAGLQLCDGEIRNADGKKVAEYLEGDDWIFLSSEQVEWSHFTGLGDKNGVEAYEGDIIADSQIVYEVRFGEWFNEDLELIGFYLYSERYGQGPLGRGDFDVITIIGNIYQHPHLLKK